ncbi:MAG: efflux RND transporter periplasmic adaptor subunit [Porphyromonadaceae bacterium]|nr:efflux RND transporter periplasmic adaptor subunit [Porphyromonadaceae bacterium]
MYRKLWKPLTLGLILGLGGCVPKGKDTAQAESNTPEQEVRLVEIASVVHDSIEVRLRYSTQLEPQVRNAISSQTGGRLQHLSVKVGDRVTRGEEVARLDGFQLTQTKIQLDDAKLGYERADDLYKVGGISRAQWEQARSAYQIAQQAYSNLSSNVVLRSPISGVVTAKHYDAGDMTTPSQPVLIVEQINPIKATVRISEQHFALLKRGMTASVTVRALEGKSFEGRIANIFPTVEARTHTIPVEVEIPNPSEQLRPGMYSQVELDLGRREAVLVPDKAVVKQIGTSTKYVYLYQDGKAIYREVELGELHGNRYEVLSGLEVGEPVIVSSLSSMQSGTKVRLGGSAD